jgi:putative ABC transport system permease protein
MAALLTDLRYALRMLARSPGFAAASVLTLALGIGANTAIFTTFDCVLLRPLPFRDPGRLVAIQEVIPKFANLAPNLPVNAKSFLEWRGHARTLEGIAMFGESLANLTSAGDPARITMARASMFPVLGIEPQLGRTFTEDEDRPGYDRVVVLSDRLWSDRFHRDPAVLGSKIVLDGTPYEVIGVMPAGFEAPRTSQLQAVVVADDYAQLWKPFGLKDFEIDEVGDFNFGCIARLKPAISAARANAELNVIQAAWLKQVPVKVEILAAIVPLQQQIAGRSRQSLILLLAAVGAVLLIVCVNIANLLLARAAGRRREMAIRTAIGARVGRLVGQTLTESMLLAAAGGVLGTLLAYWGLLAILLRAPVELPRVSEVRIDWSVAVFTFLLTVASGAFFGILPAWRMARTDPQGALRADSQTLTESRRGGRLRQILIAGEVALSVMCLAVGGLLLRSFVQLMHVDRGFQAEHAITVKLGLPAVRYPSQADTARFVRALVENVRSQPGVVEVGESNMLPLEGEGNNNLVATEGSNVPLADRPLADFRSANADFFHSMGIPLLEGRTFRECDGQRLVAAVSASLAHRMWPHADPIGKRFHQGDDRQPWIEVVGVVGDVRGASLQKAPNPTAYLPYWQRNQHSVGLVVRTAMDPSAAVAAVRGAIRTLDRELPIPRFETLGQLVDDSVAQRRFQLDLVLLFALAALAAATLGVYGVISQSVAQRTNEIGIRMALGASAASVWRLVLRQGLAPVSAGLAVGLAESLAAGRLLSGLLFGVRPTDPLVLGAVALALLAAAASACYLPARRATRVDPLVALRYE